MKFLIVFFLLITAVVIFSCRSQKVDLDQSDEPKIFFGSGGGFSGISKQYCLLANGHIYKKETLHDEWKRIHKGKSEDAQPYFEMIHELDIRKISVNEPGNHYRYIEHKTDEYRHRVTWGRNPDDVPAEIKDLYKALTMFIKNNIKTGQ